MFEALTERDGQLRSLIENSNRVFQATASRDEQLKETFIALPTFERESALTLERLAEFSVDTDPLITQLRPAARELSPTLQDLGALSPDLEALFRELNPLIDASVKGFPAAERVLEDARPLIAQLDPTMRQLEPIVDFLGLYKPELTAFLANTPAATQARDTSGVHYLRTVNPLNPENLAVYPRRIGSNRPNAYAKPGHFNAARAGHAGVRRPPLRRRTAEHHQRARCRRCRPRSATWSRRTCSTGSSSSASAARRATCPAGPCRLQGPYNFGGEITQYPHVERAVGHLPSLDAMTGFERIVRASARRPARVLAVVAVLAVAGGVLALRLEPSAAMDTLVGRGADSFQATETYRERFGDHSVIVLVRGDLPKLVLTSNLGRLVGLEGCLSGNKPEGQAAPGGARLAVRPAGARPSRSRSSTGPAPSSTRRPARSTTRSRSRCRRRRPRRRGRRAPRGGSRARRASRRAEQKRLGESARQLVYAQFVRDLLQINLRYGLGLTRLPSIDDPEFVSALVFDASRGAETPKARFAYLFPSSESALIQVRLKPNLTDEQREEAVALVREAVRMPEWRLTERRGLHGDRRAGGRRRPHRRAGRLDAAPAGGRPRADGARARARLPQPAAAGAAGDRAGRGGDHLRGDRAARPAADHGLDRRPAGAARARGRLRDPVPGARAGGGRRRARRRGSRCR